MGTDTLTARLRSASLRRDQAEATYYRRLAQRSRGRMRREFIRIARMCHAMSRARLETAHITGNLSYVYDDTTRTVSWRTL